MLYKVFDFADKEAHDVMVPRPEVVGPLGRPAAPGGLAAVDRLALHALSGLSRLARRRPRHPPRSRPLSARSTTAASRTSSSRRSSGPPTSSPRRRTSPRCWPSSGGRTSTWRSWSTSTARSRGSSRSRICSRRSSARSRTSTTSRTSRSSASTTATSASTARSRSTTSTSSSAASCRRRTTTPSPASSSASWACAEPGDEVEYDGLRFKVVEVDGQRIERLEVEFVERELEDAASRPVAVGSPRAVRPHRRARARAARRDALPRVEAALADEPRRPPVPGRVALVRDGQP